MKKLLAIAALAATMATPAVASEWNANVIKAYKDGESASMRSDRLKKEIDDMIDAGDWYSIRWNKIVEVAGKEGWDDMLNAYTVAEGAPTIQDYLYGYLLMPVSDNTIGAYIPSDPNPGEVTVNSTVTITHFGPNSSLAGKYQVGGYEGSINDHILDSFTGYGNYDTLDEAMAKLNEQVKEAVDNAYNVGFDDGFKAGYKEGWRDAEAHHGIN